MCKKQEKDKFSHVGDLPPATNRLHGDDAFAKELGSLPAVPTRAFPRPRVLLWTLSDVHQLLAKAKDTVLFPAPCDSNRTCGQGQGP